MANTKKKNTKSKKEKDVITEVTETEVVVPSVTDVIDEWTEKVNNTEHNEKIENIVSAEIKVNDEIVLNEDMDTEILVPEYIEQKEDEVLSEEVTSEELEVSNSTINNKKRKSYKEVFGHDYMGLIYEY